MPIPYDRYDWLMLKDIERCPYVPKEYQYRAWHLDDDRRMELIALDRYADFLQGKLKDEDTPRPSPKRILIIDGDEYEY